jgi:hypothetical protein
MVSEEAVGLVSSVVFGAETPVHIGKDWFILEINCPEDAAAYLDSSQTAENHSVRSRAYERLGHFQVKTMEVLRILKNVCY